MLSKHIYFDQNTPFFYHIILCIVTIFCYQRGRVRPISNQISESFSMAFFNIKGCRDTWPAATMPSADRCV